MFQNKVFIIEFVAKYTHTASTIVISEITSLLLLCYVVGSTHVLSTIYLKRSCVIHTVLHLPES